MHQITALPAFNDNYIWCIHAAGKAIVVDPGDADVVQHYLKANNLQLVAILITHHHWDHVDGLPQLQQQWPQVSLYLPAAEQLKIKHIADHSHYLHADDQLEIPELGLGFRIISTPGHTLGHLCYVTEQTEQSWLFCGDTLFSGGCGRLFEGSAAQMHQSLTLLNELPADTLVFCTHEYTISNLKFALEVEPDNQAIVEHLGFCQNLRQQGGITLPTTLQLERLINPFLRCEQPQLQQQWQQTDAQNLFKFLREWKNRF
ncbi:hydroxyacylglutathione hydrolase [Rheinheimera riviphila]|uniref:Hydroxyacylglutathione hydrolase n=1 Tax=Rheinheimera riviphila TaxID=1834037 RepID=A0A437QRP9_9GAMM|nr:hydroxyacylglutathione hydrolase [Rheinheimera riviphila]RVU37185.1 hydroxyacylglutathione hydrolase [Rheinheimera riviphila]